MKDFNNELETEDCNETTHMNINKKEKLIDQIYSLYGYGIINIKIYILAFLILLIEGINMTFFATLIIPLKSYFIMTDGQIQVISSIFFLMVGIGSLSAGKLTERFQRTRIITISSFIIAICSIGLSLITNIYVFGLIRFIIAIFIGLIVPIVLNLLAEYLPLKWRSAFLTSVWIGYGVGQFFLIIIVYIIMPTYDLSKFKLTLFISSIPSILVFVICLLFVKDSPRNLILSKQIDKAMTILESMKGSTINDIDKQVIISEINNGVNKNYDSNFKDIFKGSKMLITSILLLFIWIEFSILFYGPIIIAALTLKEYSGEKNNENIVKQQIIVNVIGFIIFTIGVSITEIKYFGRNKTCILGMFLSSIFLIILLTFPQNFAIFFAIHLSTIGVAMNVNTTYTSEIYPTKIRDIAMGFLFFMTRLGGFVSQIVYIGLHNYNLWMPYYFSLANCIILIVLILLLPIDTCYRPLDEELENIDKDNKYS